MYSVVVNFQGFIFSIPYDTSELTRLIFSLYILHLGSLDISSQTGDAKLLAHVSCIIDINIHLKLLLSLNMV